MRSSIEADDPNAKFPRWEVANLRDVAFGRIHWAFDLIIGPVTIECRVVVDEDGRPKFATPAQIKEAFTQTYRSNVDVDRVFMRRVFDDVVARLQQNTAPARIATAAAPAPNAWAEDQEARLERAIADFDGAE
jgi:hypothetical protein